MSVNIPEDLMDNIEKRLRNHVNSKKKQKRVKSILITTLMICIIPLTVFAYQNYFSINDLRPWASKGSEKYIKPINQKAAFKGTQIELSNVLTDDVGLDMGVIIRTPNDLKNYTGPFIIKGDLKINGKSENELSPNIGYMFYNKSGENEYSGVINREMANLPDKFSLELNIKEIVALESSKELPVASGEWVLRAEVNKTDIEKQTAKAKPNITRKYPLEDISISDVIATPLSLKVYSLYNIYSNKLNHRYSFFVVDDMGREHYQVGSSSIQYTNSNGNLINKYISNYVPSEAPPKFITLIPCEDRQVYTPKSININNLRVSQVLNGGDLGKLIVKDISNNGNNYTLTLRAEGLLPYTLAFNTNILDEETKEVKSNSISTIINQIKTPENSVEFKLEFNDYDSKKTYTLNYNGGMKIYKDDAITVNLN